MRILRALARWILRDELEDLIGSREALMLARDTAQQQLAAGFVRAGQEAFAQVQRAGEAAMWECIERAMRERGGLVVNEDDLERAKRGRVH